jgi:hypothetical protein
LGAALALAHIAHQLTAQTAKPPVKWETRRRLIAAGEYLRQHHAELFRDNKLRRHFNETLFNGPAGQNDGTLKNPYDPTLAALLAEPSFQDLVVRQRTRGVAIVRIRKRKSRQAKIVLAEMAMVQQSPIDEQIREYILQQERMDEARRQPAPISVRQERRKWERRLGYFMLAGGAVVVFALSEYFPDKPGQVVLIVLGGGALALELLDQRTAVHVLRPLPQRFGSHPKG